VNPSLLIDSYLEWPVRLLGSLSGVRSNRDISNRAYLLSLVDSIERGIRAVAPRLRHAQLERLRPPSGAPRPAAAAAAATAQQMPEVLLRVPVSQLLSVAYVRDSDRHLLALHYSPDANGTSQLCAMSEICAVARQLLQLAYTEATLEFFDRAPSVALLQHPAAPLRHPAPPCSAAAATAAAGVAAETAAGPAAAEPARQRTRTHPGDLDRQQPVIGRRDNRRRRLAGSLASSLSRQELVTFGQLFRAWSSGASSFAGSASGPSWSGCSRLSGATCCWPAALHPGQDHQAFDEFLHDRGLRRPVTVARTASSVRSRDSSEVDLDQALGSIVAQVQRLDMSQQQFAQPSYSRSVSAASASTAGRSPGQPHKYLALDGLEDSASMVGAGGLRAKSRQGALADGSRAQILTGLAEAVDSLVCSLSRQEMEQFGQLLSNWESGAAFAGSVRPQLERLFPAERSHLLLRLRPLVPDRDRRAFEDFFARPDPDTGRSPVDELAPHTGSRQRRMWRRLLNSSSVLGRKYPPTRGVRAVVRACACDPLGQVRRPDCGPVSGSGRACAMEGKDQIPNQHPQGLRIWEAGRATEDSGGWRATEESGGCPATEIGARRSLSGTSGRRRSSRVAPLSREQPLQLRPTLPAEGGRRDSQYAEQLAKLPSISWRLKAADQAVRPPPDGLRRRATMEAEIFSESVQARRYLCGWPGRTGRQFEAEAADTAARVAGLWQTCCWLMSSRCTWNLEISVPKSSIPDGSLSNNGAESLRPDRLSLESRLRTLLAVLPMLTERLAQAQQQVAPLSREQPLQLGRTLPAKEGGAGGPGTEQLSERDQLLAAQAGRQAAGEAASPLLRVVAPANHGALAGCRGHRGGVRVRCRAARRRAGPAAVSAATPAAAVAAAAEHGGAGMSKGRRRMLKQRHEARSKNSKWPRVLGELQQLAGHRADLPRG
uniref:CCM2_C domain-containing protein n=1 Tax=Macrostomum lignano TaxID=282301 RepID=A0A1I8FH07_9PLAT